MKDAVARARTLVEALPYIQRFSGRTVVVKYGGHAMVDPELKVSFARDIVLLKQVGIHPVVVHGGGPQIGALLKRIGKESRFVAGMRITDRETMEVVEMVLAGLVNKEIVANILKVGGRAVGLSGKDGALIEAEKLTLAADDPALAAPEIIDLGHVGRVRRVNPEALKALEDAGYIPVVAPVGLDPQSGETFNINADYVAGALAAALGAIKLVLLTDVPGVLDRDGRLISRMTPEEAQRRIESGEIAGGMVPKVRCATEAIARGVEAAHIV
ncbi:MAG: acetylglutamate kinase, partial [Zetaproteobacteria bacterium]